MKRLVVVGAGKASAAMAVAFQNRLPETWLKSGRVTGWINVPEGTIPNNYSLPVHLHAGRPAALNEPTEQGVLGSEKMIQLVQQCSVDDVVICLLSGGASALLPLPLTSITLADKREVTRTLSAAGATIEELNTVRIALSRIKGGGLARACRAASLFTLVISDVLGDDLRFIGSGPTVWASKPTLVPQELMEKYEIPRNAFSENVWTALNEPAAKKIPEPTCHVEHLILANNATAVDASGVEAVSRGYRYLMNCARQSEGDAESLGREFLERCSVWSNERDAPDCFISGGEPTVRLVPSGLRGRGGRNQQLVLAALQRRIELRRKGTEIKPICFLSGGTDGEDGPTDVAGAWFDRELEKKVEASGVQLIDYLNRNDAYSFFERFGGHLKTGPTGTNVCDLRVVVW
jgi:glycerate-2-kinase